MSIKPPSKPQATLADIQKLITVSDALVVVGIRGYYKDSMGKPGVNDRGVYDDALFIIAPGHFSSYNGNTDPSSYRKGRGTGSSKGMACLKAGVYRSHQLGLHRGQYTALVQTAGKVTVTRDGSPNYDDTGYFGINIHRGGDGTTSSLGCQTIPPGQWFSFIENIKRLVRENDQKVVPYILVEWA